MQHLRSWRFKLRDNLLHGMKHSDLNSSKQDEMEIPGPQVVEDKEETM